MDAVDEKAVTQPGHEPLSLLGSPSSFIKLQDAFTVRDFDVQVLMDVQDNHHPYGNEFVKRAWQALALICVLLKHQTTKFLQQCGQVAESLTTTCSQTWIVATTLARYQGSIIEGW